MTQAANISAFYCHGLPGHPDELAWAMDGAAHGNPVELSRLTPVGETYTERTLAGLDLAARKHAAPTPIIGFSLGAMAALTIAAERPGRINHVHLIAPAVPLQLGDYIDDMAGKPVFKAAQSGPRQLGIFTAAQALAFRALPAGMIRALFASAPESEKALLKDKAFMAALHSGLKLSLRTAPAAYKAELLHYVSDWTPILSKVRAPVTLWHGDADTWAPPQMSADLAARLTHAEPLKTFEGLSHYGALRRALPTILNDISSASS